MRFFGFRRKRRENNFSLSQAYVDSILGQFVNAAEVAVTPATAMGIATVFACVNVRAKTIATLPLKMYERSRDGKTKSLALANPLYEIVNSRPNSEMSSVDFRMAMESALSLHNNAYAQIRRDNAGRVAELVPVHPSDVCINRSDEGMLVYKVRSKEFAASDILHIRGFTASGIQGSDLVCLMRDVFGLAIAMETNAAKFFANNSSPGLTLEHPGVLSEQAYARLQQSIEKRHKGVENAYRMMILEEGLKLARARSANTESQFDESRDRTDKQIARVFGVPPHKVGILDNLPRANIEQQNIEFVTDTLRPICVTWENALSLALLSREERRRYFFQFDLRGLLRGDFASRVDGLIKLVQWGIITRNEARAIEDYNPGPEELDEYLQPMNMGVAGEEEPAPQNRLNGILS